MAVTMRTCCGSRRIFMNSWGISNGDEKRDTSQVVGIFQWTPIPPSLTPKFPNLCRSLGPMSICNSSIQSTAKTEETIQIPKRKKRDATSILKALAETTKREAQSPHYKYMDDPYLIPTSALQKRSYSLAKASGQRAAQYVLQQYPDCFVNDVAEPSIPAYLPSPKGFQHEETGEAGLQERIRARKPKAAFESYEKIKEEGVVLREAVEQELLELLCVYNSEDPQERGLPDEQWFMQDYGQDNTKKIRKTWKDNGAAETVFNSMTNKTAKAYSALIRGMAKYLQVDKAYDLYQEMLQKRHPVDVETYNAILNICQFLRDKVELKWSLAQEILHDMREKGVEPNLQTFHAILYTLSRVSRWKDAPVLAVKTINEMIRCNVEPSLATWYYLVAICYTNNDSRSTILYEILDHIEGKQFTLRDANDVEFFLTAMAKCYQNLKDMELGYKLDALLNTGNNAVFLGDSVKETRYYTYFLRLLCMFESIDTIMEHYDRITPHVYTPTLVGLDELLRAVELNDGYKYLPKIWSDLVLFDYTRREDLVEQVIACMAKQKHEPQLQEQLTKICSNFIEELQADAQSQRQQSVHRTLRLTGSMAGNLAQIHLHGGDFDKAWEMFQLYKQQRNHISGFPSPECLKALADSCVEGKDADKALEVVIQLADQGHPMADSLADKLKSELELTEEHKKLLEDTL